MYRTHDADAIRVLVLCRLNQRPDLCIVVDGEHLLGVDGHQRPIFKLSMRIEIIEGMLFITPTEQIQPTQVITRRIIVVSHLLPYPRL